MERTTVDGIVLKTSPTGESDVIVWILTRTGKLVRAFAKGAKNTKSRLHAAAGQFAFCSFTYTEKNGTYTVNEAEIKELFFELRTDFDRLTVAQYFCEILLKTLPEEAEDEIYLRLLLNSLHFLCTGSRPVLQIKTVFELRIAAETGYLPDLVACAGCAAYLTDMMYFDCPEGKLYCSDCGKSRALPILPAASVSAMRHIVYSPFEKIFSFELNPELLEPLSRLTARYLSVCTHRTFKTLDYIK